MKLPVLEYNMAYQTPDKRSGFTLVELTIVLGIISLIAGAILIGQSLVKTAQLRKVTSEYNAIKTAVESFYGKYMAYPGDVTNATTLWPSASTYDGNGNGVMGYYIFEFMEDSCTFHHLSLAKLLPGTFVSDRGPSKQFQKNYNLKPSEAIPDGLFYLGAPYVFDSSWNTRNGIAFGKPYGATGFPLTGVMSVEDAYAIDVKIDDGKANKGFVYAADSYNQPAYVCSSAALLAGNGLDYNHASTEPFGCALTFWLQ